MSKSRHGNMKFILPFLAGFFMLAILVLPVYADVAGIPNPLATGDSITGFIAAIAKLVVKIAGVFSVFFLIYSGYLYVVAAGNDEKLKEAKKTFYATVIGIAILLGATVLGGIICGTIKQVGNLGDNLDCSIF